MTQPFHRSKRSFRRQSGNAGSVVLVIFLGAVCGVAGAVVQFKQSGGDVNKLVSRVEGTFEQQPGSGGGEASAKSGGVAKAPAKVPVKQPKAAGGTSSAKGDGTPVAAVGMAKADPATPAPEIPAAAPDARVQPVRAGTPPPAVPVAPVASSHTFEDVFKALREAEEHFKIARFEEARSGLARFETARVPEKLQKEYQLQRTRSELHATLLRESMLTPTQDPPKMTTIEFRVPKGPFTGTILASDDKKVEVLLLSNIAVTFEKFEILQMTDVDAVRSKRMVEAECERRWKQLSNRKPMDAYRLGEFCLRNGLPGRVAECFDKASQVAAAAGVDLVATVREEKAESLYDTFVFFLSIGNIQEARGALGLLRLRYPDSPCIARAEDMERDTVKTAMGELSNKIKVKPVEYASAPAAKADPLPVAGDGAKPPAPVAGSGAEPPKPVSVRIEPPDPPQAPMTSLPGDKQDSYKALVAEANACYDKALDHLKRTDPKSNPDNWLKENNAALELLTKAYNGYNQALDIYNDSSLWSRVTDTNFKRVFCRKRQINK
jgi:tetratricopeptide (TPR) repeat protein